MLFMIEKNRLLPIESWMDRYISDRKFAGSSVLINANGTETFFAARGLRNLEDGTPFQRDTIVRLYSMTKPVTSVVLMMLVEDGLVHLDARVDEFVPEFAQMHALVPGATALDQVEACATPTLHQLLTHTSGITYAFNPGVVPQALDDQKIFFGPAQGSLADMTAKLASLPLAFRPGARWEYSLGIDVIGRVIEVITGQTLEDVFRERLFDPLGMQDTGFSIPDASLDRFAHLYTPLDGNPMGLNDTTRGAETLRLADDAEGSQLRRTTLFSGGGGLVGTLDNYMAFTEFLHSGMAGPDRLLSQSTLNFMMQNHLAGDIASMGPSSFAEQPMEGMGFGIGGAVVLDAARSRAPGNVGDFSWGGMASTFFWIDRVRGLSVVFLTQLSPSSSYPARPQLKALVHGALS